MVSTWRHIVRHILAAIFLILAVISGVLPILQGWLFLLLAVLILAVEYRWVRNLVLRRLYRRSPHLYRKATVFRRRVRIRLGHFCRRLIGRPHTHGPDSRGRMENEGWRTKDSHASTSERLRYSQEVGEPEEHNTHDRYAPPVAREDPDLRDD